MAALKKHSKEDKKDYEWITKTTKESKRNYKRERIEQYFNIGIFDKLRKTTTLTKQKGFKEDCAATGLALRMSARDG